LNDERSEVNVGLLLSDTARRDPNGVAVIEQGRKQGATHAYRQITFRELDDDSSRIAAQLNERGIGPGTRIVLLVPPSIDFVSLVFALFKTGAVTILIDPGMGREHLIRCLAEVNPDGFIAIPRAQAARLIYRGRFPNAKLNVTVGGGWWGALLGGSRGTSLRELRRNPRTFDAPSVMPDDPAAIIFTTGSTGPPKGVLYRHGNFQRQVFEIRDFYGVKPGETDVACFPLFALFDVAMGATTVFPSMDFTRPADVNPEHVVAAIEDWNATQAFGSPALWNTVAGYCERTHLKFSTLKRILSAGAPVPPHVLRRMTNTMADDGEMHTPYGATEALPVASISAREVLGETAAQSEQGAGTCVGSRFPGIEWKVVAISEEPLTEMSGIEELPQGEIGELIVTGSVVTTEYVTRVEANRLSKISDGKRFWHRMGDVGYCDAEDRFWYCGRKSHRVPAGNKTMYTIPCEAIVNRDKRVYRSALVNAGRQNEPWPVLVVELWPGDAPQGRPAADRLISELLALAKSNDLTNAVCDVLIHPNLPVDIRHNSKIFREQVAEWAREQLR
jgi:acyl-CoA synthetase (AMP-forming)/AMP-acid ligase II